MAVCGISNYEKLLSTDIFRTAMWNIGRIWLFGGLIVMLLSLLLGVILTSGIKGKKVFRAIIYLPNIVSAVALATMWLQYVYSPKFGLLKSVLEFVGLDKLARPSGQRRIMYLGAADRLLFGMVAIIC
nr:hypothetical protein [Suipraeoptans intestinalis]